MVENYLSVIAESYGVEYDKVVHVYPESFGVGSPTLATQNFLEHSHSIDPDYNAEKEAENLGVPVWAVATRRALV